MYPLVSTLSIIARYWICYLTIEQLPIFSNEGIGWLFGQIVSIYAIFRLICYPIVGSLATKYEIRSSTMKSIMYFIFYLPVASIYWISLLLLTHIFHILPINILGY